VVTSYQPNTSSCTGGGNAWLAVLNYATGGTFPLPELDLNGDGQLNSLDTVAGGMNPVAMALGPVYASSVTLLSSPSSSSGIGTHKLVATSNVAIKSVGDRGASKNRTAWWELLH